MTFNYWIKLLIARLIITVCVIVIAAVIGLIGGSIAQWVIELIWSIVSTL